MSNRYDYKIMLNYMLKYCLGGLSKYFIGFLILFTAPVFSQTYNFQFSFGQFQNAQSFYINSAGMIYITDTGTDEIYKYDTLGTHLKEAGGYGWKENTFDDPYDVFATPLNVYVCDKNNHRVQRFDKDLNFISLLYTRESDNSDEQFGSPLSCTSSPQGDLYILDSENKRIIKFDLFGNFIQNFGGIDAGEYSLSNPVKLAISPIGYVYVLDESKVIIFDQYGNGIGILPVGKEIQSINIIFNSLTLNSHHKIFCAILSSSDTSLSQLTLNGQNDIHPIQSSLIYNNKLYILTQGEIQVFELSNH